MPMEKVQLIFLFASWIFFQLTQKLESRVGGRKENRYKKQRGAGAAYHTRRDAIKTGHMGDHMVIFIISAAQNGTRGCVKNRYALRLKLKTDSLEFIRKNCIRDKIPLKKKKPTSCWRASFIIPYKADPTAPAGTPEQPQHPPPKIKTTKNPKLCTLLLQHRTFAFASQRERAHQSRRESSPSSPESLFSSDSNVCSLQMIQINCAYSIKRHRRVNAESGARGEGSPRRHAGRLFFFYGFLCTRKM